MLTILKKVFSLILSNLEKVFSLILTNVGKSFQSDMVPPYNMSTRKKCCSLIWSPV